MNPPISKQSGYALLVLLAAIAPIRAATVIDTTPPNNFIGPFSDMDWATWGQTFRVPLQDNYLKSFSVTLRIENPGEFAFFVMAWDGAKASGPVLFQSEPVVTGSDVAQTFIFETDLALVPGQNYVGFVSSSFFQQTGSFLMASIYCRTDNPYPDGQLVGEVNRSNFGVLTQANWTIPTISPDLAGYDLAFRAEFEPTFIPIEIDVRPGSQKNPVNPKSRGVLPVAVLSGATFDATTIDVSSLGLGPSTAAPVSRPKAYYEDVNRDGRLDLMVYFDTADLGLQRGVTTIVLIGRNLQGRPIRGEDSVSIVP